LIFFVDSLTLPDFGFDFQFVENGRPAYHPSDLLKLYIYGYLNRMHSSRTLEKECGRNIELMWLMRGFLPITIPLPILETIQSHFSGFSCHGKTHFELIGGSLVAGDSTQGSKLQEK
jgi:hypothetical protein